MRRDLREALAADVVSAVRAAPLSGRPGSVYNVGGGERIALNEVLRLVETITAPASSPIQANRSLLATLYPALTL